ncbi:hypothetical protein SDC9_129769 [bioreactor metagenome]|uniref:Uncharacterized protein n=1 Tax=bioreactor metagenome TaxID=1076179 RepID=A0A645D0K8_9ZZZZ
MHLLHGARLVDGKEQHAHTNQHKGRQHQKHGQIAGVVGFRDQHFDQNQHCDAANGTHQIDDRVALAAQGFRGHVRHQRHGRAAVAGHGKQCKAKAHHKQRQAVNVVADRH